MSESKGEGGNLFRPAFPSPGSPIAQERGCKCPDEVNDMGRGNPQLAEAHMGRRWVYDLDCPVHELDESLPCAGVDEHARWLILVRKGEV